MSALRDIQLKFKQALNADTDMSDYIAAGSLTANECLQIYQNNIFTCLTKSLQITYPCIEKLVGQHFFAYLCQHYIKKISL